MNTKDVFKRINRLNDESYVVEQLVKRINDDYNETMELCPHELVFMLHDNHPRKRCTLKEYAFVQLVEKWPLFMILRS